jgi:hypothetical protein
MRKIKTFEIFESIVKEVPSHFIPLKSIGHYLDPNDGMTYTMKHGGYEDEPYPMNEYMWREFAALPDEEKAAIDAVCRSCEEIVEPIIDWEVIEDIKDVALANEILDKGYYVRIAVRYGFVGENIYTEWYAHDKKEKIYARLFKNDFAHIANGARDFSYIISILRQTNYGGYTSISDRVLIEEFLEQVRGMNPEKSIAYSRW